jgi:hypothetical protein
VTVTVTVIMPTVDSTSTAEGGSFATVVKTLQGSAVGLASLALAIRTFHKTAFRLYEASYTLSV